MALPVEQYKPGVLKITGRIGNYEPDASGTVFISSKDIVAMRIHSLDPWNMKKTDVIEITIKTNLWFRSKTQNNIFIQYDKSSEDIIVNLLTDAMSY